MVRFLKETRKTDQTQKIQVRLLLELQLISCKK